MARQEADREDLIAEATALVERGEFAIAGDKQAVTAGRRRNGGWSIYFGSDPCYHFDEAGRLRRAFAEGKLYRTQGHTLAELERVRTADATELRRRDLSIEELKAFLINATQRLEQLRQQLQSGQVHSTRSFPEQCEVGSILRAALERILNPALRLAPAIPGRR